MNVSTQNAPQDWTKDCSSVLSNNGNLGCLKNLVKISEKFEGLPHTLFFINKLSSVSNHNLGGNQ
jgi:hypothetical protein